MALAGLVSVSGCADANQSAQKEASATVSCEYPSDGEPAKPVDPPKTTDVPNKGEAKVTISMTAGDVELTLDRSKAPCAVNSFLSLAEQGYFDDTRCHRLVDSGIFVLQCGDPSATGLGGPGYTFADEGVSSSKDPVNYASGTVAMANRGPDTNGSQFFIVWDETPLPLHYVPFGKASDEGLAVVREIAAQGVAADDGKTPIAEARIKNVTVG